MDLDALLKEATQENKTQQIADKLAKELGGYVIRSQISTCRICSRKQDLRCGVCFTCADKVDGKRVDGGHLLWDVENESNQWIVKD